jgi:serine phosphatase RsbU (regulator of sigma subunit)
LGVPDYPGALWILCQDARGDLQPDDAVLFYTDGVIEARTPDGELFGLDRLADLPEREAASGQSAEEMLRRLVRAVLDHQAGGLRDDVTLLLMQWAGPAQAGLLT